MMMKHMFLTVMMRCSVDNYRSAGCCLQTLFDYDEYGLSWDDIELCRSEGEAYAKAYLLNGGETL